VTDEDKPAFAAAMTRLAVALREKESDVVMMRVYFDALRDLEIEFVVLAAERFVTNGQWFPKVREWRAMAGRVETERRQAHRALLSKWPTPLCDACADTGWIRNDENRVSRCGCHEMRRLEVLGRRAWPALPPSEQQPDAGGAHE
jgi:hypothetical protein